jgi:cystathionine beta-synthase
LKDKLTKDDVVVVIFHDHGSRYLAKIFNDEWMRQKGFLDKKGMTARDLTSNRKGIKLFSVEKTETIKKVLKLMNENDFSQIPVTEDGRIIGSVNEYKIYQSIISNPELKNQPIENIIQPAFPFVDISASIDELADMLKADNDAVLVKDFKQGDTFIITRYDILNALTG